MTAHGERRRLLLGEVAELHALETAVRANEVAQRIVLGWVDEAEPLERDQRRSRFSISSAIATSSQFGRFSAITRPLRSKISPRFGGSGSILKRLPCESSAEALVVDDLQLHEPRDEQTQSSTTMIAAAMMRDRNSLCSCQWSFS